MCCKVTLRYCRWLSVRLETLGALAAFSAAVLAIEARGAASQMGLTLSYALQITSLTSMTVRLASVAENAFNAVERIAEYSRLKEEAPAVIEDSAPDGWPSAGKVSVPCCAAMCLLLLLHEIIACFVIDFTFASSSVCAIDAFNIILSLCSQTCDISLLLVTVHR